MSFPDFLGIGAQKAGTTWLHHNLSRHPRIWLPPVKEIHHLDHRPPWLPERLLARKAHLRAARDLALRELSDRLAGRGGERLGWALRLWLAPRDDDWYARLFPDGWPGRTGEICPGYARLSEARVATVAARRPDLRIVYLLRDPVERAWSAAAMRFRKPRFGGDIARAPETAVVAFLRRAKTDRHGDYLRNLAAWERHFPAEQIFVGFFDRLREDPRAFLLEILAFLGVGSDPSRVPPDVNEPRNRGRGERPPPHFRRFLAELYIDRIRALHARFANAYTAAWLERAERWRRGETEERAA